MKYVLPVQLSPRGLFKVLFILFVLILTAFTSVKYEGTPYVYLLFSLIFNALFLAGFREKRIFFDTFIGIFLWLGFWLKLSVTLSFFGGQFDAPVGSFNFTGAAFDNALNVSSCGAAAFLLSSFLRENFFSYSAGYSPGNLDSLQTYYARFRKPIWAVYAVVICLLAWGNAYFGFYQKGLPPRTVLPFGLSSVYTLIILFGMASVSAVLLNFEFKLKKSPYIPAILTLLECFLSNVSMLSRGMFLNGMALILGVLENARLRSERLSLLFKAVIICVFVGFGLGSIFSVNLIRVDAFAVSEALDVESPKNVEIAPTLASATHLNSFIYRWVGLEGVMSVISYRGLGWELWSSSWRENYSSVGTSMYDRNIVGDSPYVKGDIGEKHFITLPGIIAFFYYPGSWIFLFFSMFVLGIFAAAVEVAVYKLSGGNIVLCALLGQVVAGRYVHFGYVPSRSYLLFGGVLLVAALVFIANYALTHSRRGRRAMSVDNI